MICIESNGRQWKVKGQGCDAGIFGLGFSDMLRMPPQSYSTLAQQPVLSVPHCYAGYQTTLYVSCNRLLVSLPA